jgi:hypothetical protein
MCCSKPAKANNGPDPASTSTYFLPHHTNQARRLIREVLQELGTLELPAEQFPCLRIDPMELKYLLGRTFMKDPVSL